MATNRGEWAKRKQLTLANNSGQTFEANTTYTVTINTKELLRRGRFTNDCDDLRVFYQPSDSAITKINYYFDIAQGATNCSDSTATKIYFPLQANISNAATTNAYYLYYEKPQCGGRGDNRCV
jgi:hypothetical protein